MVRYAKYGSQTFNKAPIEEVDLDKDMLDLEIGSLYGDQGIEMTIDSQDKTLQELPQYQGSYEGGSDIMILPSQKKTHKPVMDSQGLQEFLSTLVKCTLTVVAELLKVRPQIWKDIGRCLEKMGIKSPIKTMEQEIENWETPKRDTRPVPIN